MSSWGKLGDAPIEETGSAKTTGRKELDQDEGRDVTSVALLPPTARLGEEANYASKMAFTSEKYILFTTFRRDGTPVSTPVWVVELDADTFGFWTSSESGKAKRLAHTSRVTVQPCNARGVPRPGTSATNANARLVEGDEYRQICAKVVTKYGLMTKFTKLLGTLGGILKGKRIPYGDRAVVVSLSAA